MAVEQKIYPRGAVALASGNLIQATNIKVSNTNNAKQVHTIAQKGSGVTFGVEETTVTFELVISEDGEERDWLAMLKQGQIKQLRIKVPGRTMTINGAVKQDDYELPLDDAIKQTITFIGHMDD